MEVDTIPEDEVGTIGVFAVHEVGNIGLAR